MATRFIELPGEINTVMPTYVAQHVADALNGYRKTIHGNKLVLLGMAYKKEVDDPRESPGFEPLGLLPLKGADVTIQR
jgi:UDP-N-acetyl-D-glucosamine dehydrogenase